MKIGITGHTSGIGKGLFESFTLRGDEVFGFSRSNNYDLSVFSNINRISFFANTYQFDAFILNAHFRYSQIDLLYSFDELWKNDSSKTIVVISSTSGDGIKNWPHQYAIQKAALDKTVEQLQSFRPYRLINIRPGYVDTPRVKEVEDPKLSVSDVVSSVLWAIDMPKNILIRNITLTPRY
jgi:NADP-dependent 3-hydroxy acid dehydrogenase YdfG